MASSDLVSAMQDARRRQMQHYTGTGHTLNPNDAFSNTAESWAHGIYNSAPNMMGFIESGTNQYHDPTASYPAISDYLKTNVQPSIYGGSPANVLAMNSIPAMLSQYFNPGGGQEMASAMLSKGLGTDELNAAYTPETPWEKGVSFAGEAFADPVDALALPYLGAKFASKIPDIVSEGMRGLRQSQWKSMEGAVKPMATRVDKRLIAERRVNQLFDDAIEYERRKAPRRNMAVRNEVQSLPAALSARGVKGDDLLNAQDLAEDLRGVGAKIDDNGMVTVFHRTSAENAQQIQKTGQMRAKEPDIFFSTSRDSEYGSGFGDSVVEAQIPLEQLRLDDIFPGTDASVSIHAKGPIGTPVKVNVTKPTPASVADDLPMDEASRMARADAEPEEGYKRLYNASTVDRDPQGYLEPHVSDWVNEVAGGASDDVPIEDMVSNMIYMSDDPIGWHKMIVGRKLGKHPDKVTMGDIRQHGRLNIVDADMDADEIFQVGDYSNDQSLTDLYGNRRKFWDTNIYDEGDVYTGEGRLVELPIGPEPDDWISREAQEITHSLTGDDLVKFLKSKGLAGGAAAALGLNALTRPERKEYVTR